ncbi:hypothetical protein DBR11_14580 [Pedobacter sp. HMWF019]|nr:hypothetical protein DBR11_14580 [Pedobacter sp. HMWF019]
MAGTTLINFVNYQTFWKLFEHQNEKATGVLSITARLPRLIGIGAALLVCTGIGMIALTHGVLAQQLWFRIKFVLVLLLIANNIFNGRELETKLSNMISGNASDLSSQALNLKDRLRTYYLLQLGIFLIIIFLSAYKFN